MEPLRKFLLESVFPERFSRAVYEALVMLEAVNINKEFLIREAGSPEKFKEARDNVQRLWTQETMDQQLNQKAGQKVLNILYLMEIRSPGFTTVEKLHKIHDLGIANLLDTKFLSKVNSDSTPEQVDGILSEAEQHQAQSTKVYPNLTAEEERIWNRVKVFHEFPDGFKWVYAVDDDGNVLPSIPSTITNKTMRHCGNNYGGASKDDQYWELRGPDGKAYLTVILTPDGEIQESKSYGNQVSKYKSVILPYVKWFLTNKVNGVTHRYNYGYAANNNFGVKDFMGFDQEFVDYVVENRPELIGSTEGRILFWKGALDEGIVTVDNLKEWYEQKVPLNRILEMVQGMPDYHRNSRFGKYAGKVEQEYSYYSNESIFGYNPFEVICSVCGGCPFDKQELEYLISEKKLSLEEFANYNIRLLTDDMQKIFVRVSPTNFKRLVDIAGQVASFTVSDELMEVMVQTVMDGPKPKLINHPDSVRYVDDGKTSWLNAASEVLGYMATGNPPEKVRDFTESYFNPIMDAMARYDGFSNVASNHRYYGGVPEIIPHVVDTVIRFPDLELSGPTCMGIRNYLANSSYSDNILGKVLSIGRPKIDPIFDGVSAKQMVDMARDRSSVKKQDARNIGPTVETLAKLLLEFPETRECVKRMGPVTKLGLYCKLPEDMVPRDKAIEMALENLDVYDNYSNVPSARVGVTLMAMGKFPEIIERVGILRIISYLSRYADELNALGRNKVYIITGALKRQIFDLIGGMSDEELAEYIGSDFISMIQALKEWGTPYGQEDKELLRRVFYLKPTVFSSASKNTLIGTGAVDIPFEDWQRYVDRMGKATFVEKYIIIRYKWELPDYACNYFTDFIIEMLKMGADAPIEDEFHRFYDGSHETAGKMLGRLMLSSMMTRRKVKSSVQASLRAKLDSGEVTLRKEELEWLNRHGLLTKDDVNKYVASGLGAAEVPNAFHAKDVAMYISNLDKMVGSPKLKDMLVALFKWMLRAKNEATMRQPTSVDGEITGMSDEAIKLAGKLARWCTRNRKNPAVIDAVPTDVLDQVIDSVTDVAADAKDEYEHAMARWREQDERNRKSREHPELSYMWRWNPEPDNERYKAIMSSLEALEIMRRRCSYQVDMFDKDTRK